MKRQQKTKETVKVRMKRQYGFLKLYISHDQFPDIKLTDYINKVAKSHTSNEARTTVLQAVVHHLQRYDTKGVPLAKVDKAYIAGFVGYLKNARQTHCKVEKALHANTQLHYFKMLRYCLNRAVSEGYIPCNPIDKMKNEEKPRRCRAVREYLTIDELRLLVRTPFYNALLKKAFLFSCFCGLRHCDVIALAWKDVHRDTNGNASINIVQRKTHETLSLPLSPEAVKYMPDRKNAKDTDKVFAGLISLGRSNEILDRWVNQAGIQKHITFHTARHTHATMMLTLGADLYTISKLLGHTNIQTTQIYLRLVDESKMRAIALIPEIG